MKKRRRRIDPEKARAAAGGNPDWYRDISTPEMTYYKCSQCSTESATVPRPGELCLKCRLQERIDPSEPAA